MYNYKKTKHSPYDPTKLAIHSIFRPKAELISNCGQIFMKAVSFDYLVHFIDEENIVTYVDFDYGVTFYPETPTKVGETNRERIIISRSFEKPKCITSNDQGNCTVDEEDSFYTFLNPYSFWDMDPAALKSLKDTKDRDSMSNQYPQTTTHQPRTNLNQEFCSL